MRSGRLILSSMVFLLVGVPVHSHALTVVISASAGGVVTPKTLGPASTPPTTTLSLSGLTINGFTFSATAGGSTLPQVIAQPSGGVERVYMSNTTIRAPTTSCSSTAPCKLTLTASSNVGDFPKKAPGGYPSGVAVSAFLVKADGRSNALSDTITVTGQAQGPIVNRFDPINTTPGGGTGDTPTSLPSACTGKTTCQFTASLANGGSFNAQIAETIQFQCGGATQCDPSATFSVTITFIRPGDKVTFGVGVAQTQTPTVAGTNFVGALLPHFGNFSPRVEIRRGSKFELKVPFTLNTGSNGINPPVEFVNFSLTPNAGTPYSATIPPGSFKKQKTGRFVFEGVINNANLEAKIIPLGGLNYEFRAEGNGAGLLIGAQNPVCIALTIEDDSSGGTCVSAEFE